MWEFIGFNENDDYVFNHPDYGSNTVGKYSEINTEGAQDLEHALLIVHNSIIEQ